MSPDKEFNEYLEKLKESSYQKILDSKILLSMISPGADHAPEVLLQMGIAVLHDKPIALLVFKGVNVSEHLKKLAYAIEYVDPEDREGMAEATKRLVLKGCE